MRNKYNKAFLLILLIIATLSIRVEATDLDSLNIDVFILDGGDANITMEWNYYDDLGTEHYIPINKNGIEITDLSVSRNGIAYEILDYWDIDASFEDKVHKAGIIEDESGYEICWGISDYGNNSFKVSYRVNGIIKSLNDYEMLYYTFINRDLSEAPSAVTISIGGEKDFLEEDVKLWGFGFEGLINLVDGKILWVANEPLACNNYATSLVRFNKGFFNSPYNIDSDFEAYKEMAFEDSSYDIEDSYDYQENDWEGSSYGNGVTHFSDFRLFPVILPILIFLPFVFIFIFIIGSIFLKSPKDNFNIKPKDYKGQYFREVPYKGNKDDLYYILFKLGLTSYSDYINYYLLKWIKDGVLIKFQYESGFIFKKNKDGLEISKEPDNPGQLENDFFNILKSAAGSNMKLEEKEFNNWMVNNTSRFENFIEDLQTVSKDRLIKLGYLDFIPRSSFFTRDQISLTDKGIELSENLIKFKNYLLDFSLLNERESVNVHIWDDLMLFAGIFGITDKVSKEFEKLLPQYFENNNIDLSTIYIASLYSRNISTTYNSITSSSPSSGGGGFTSGGGGGGSFGGGSGGGTR